LFLRHQSHAVRPWSREEAPFCSLEGNVSLIQLVVCPSLVLVRTQRLIQHSSWSHLP
jgi:hypothetical protein